MPFKKTGKNEFKSPSGKKFTKKQVALYYATDGFKDKKDNKKKKGTQDFNKNPMSAFRGKPKAAKKPSGKKR